MLSGGLRIPKSISDQKFMQNLGANRVNYGQLENRESMMEEKQKKNRFSWFSSFHFQHKAFFFARTSISKRLFLIFNVFQGGGPSNSLARPLTRSSPLTDNLGQVNTGFVLITVTTQSVVIYIIYSLTHTVHSCEWATNYI